jgi:CheY-like chemotaxis protein
MRRRRAIIFEDDPSVLHLLEAFFSKRGYEVMLYKEPINCPLYQDDHDSNCPNEYPCSDVVITDHRMPSMTGIELLQKQAQNGCKLTSMNKALITAHLSEKEQKALQKLGSFYLAKPFRIADISQWLDECEKRLDIETPLGIRRREKRTRVHLDVTYCVGNSDQTMTGIIANLSPSGFCLQANHDFEKAREIKVVSVLPYTCSTASARWSKTTEDGNVMTGFSCD